MKRYINIKTSFGVETVDEFDYNTKEEKKEAIRCCREYNISDRTHYYYLSQRSTKDWKNG